jgi:mono/diheme cytochrome c family protein
MTCFRALAALFVAFVLTAALLSGQQAAAPAGGAQPATSGTSIGDVERGRYLVERVVNCWECHSARDSSGRIVPGTKFMGGPMVVRPPWPIDWPNAFPRIAGLPGYSDEEGLRLLMQGAIKRDGTQLRLPMPRFRMNRPDAADVIAYLRSL